MPLKPDAAARKDKLGATYPDGTFQHRHFAVVAGILASLDRDALGITDGQHADLCSDFADGLARTNTKFDRKRFIAACG